MTRRPRTAPFAAVLAIAALALSACATPSDPAATGTAPPPSETTTPTPEPAPGSVQPASRYDLGCDDLVAADVVAAMFGVPVEPVDPLVTAASAGISVPRMSSVDSVGGLACEWSNGAPYNSQFGTNPDYVGVLVTVVPEQDAGWSSRATGAGMPAPGGSCDPMTCSMTRVASGAWIALSGAGGGAAVIDPAAGEAVADAAAAAVDAASPPAPPSTPASAIPTDCEELLPTASVESITGRTGLRPVTEAGGWSEWAEAKWIAGDMGCQWMPADVEEIVVGTHWVRGGRWAFDRIEAGGALVPAPTELTVAGADRALVRCDPSRGEGSCGVDLLVGPDWIQVTATEEAWAVAAAEEIAARLAP